jgi:hypothetical protein
VNAAGDLKDSMLPLIQATVWLLLAFPENRGAVIGEVAAVNQRVHKN